MQLLLDLLPEELAVLENLPEPNYIPAATEHFKNLCEKILEAAKTSQDETVSTTIRTSTIKDVTLGRQLIFDPHTKLHLVDKEAYIRFPHAESIFHHFGIGKDHVGYLVMTREAWAALNAPEAVEITH